MSFESAIDEALAKTPKGTIEVQRGGAKAEVDVIDSDRIGIRVSRVKVTREQDRDVAEEARALPEKLRSISEKFAPVEVAPELGGAVLRTRPEDVRDRKFFQIDVLGPREVELKRFKGPEGGERKQVDWTMTRDALGRLVDELAE